jgi:integrase/recombinase XerD
MLKQLFDQFLLEKKYGQNCSPHTIKAFVNSFKAYSSSVGGEFLPTQESVNEFRLKMVERGLSVGTCNDYLTRFRVFANWLREAGYEVGPITIKQLKEDRRILPGYTDEEIEKFLRYRPTTFTRKRLKTMILTLVDTGARIDEVLTLERDNVSLESFALKLFGKGRRERVVPISLELRRELVQFLRLHPHDLVFCTTRGKKLAYEVVHLGFVRLCGRIGVEPKGFHAFRRTFARNYLNSGGNVIFLKAVLGHSRIETTEKYVEVRAEDLKVAHLKTSILGRMK